MVKIQKISEIHPTLGFTEFDIFEKYQVSFESSELGRIHRVFPFSALAGQMQLENSYLGRRNKYREVSRAYLLYSKKRKRKNHVPACLKDG